MKILFLLLVLLFAVNVEATTYYVDCTAANDSGNGTSTGTAWKTINKVNTSTFSGDDQILFKKGCIWRETLTMPSSGTSGHPITFSAYGSGDKPKIYGSTQVSTWTNESGNLWYATASADPTSVWFVNTDKTIVWGTKQTLKTDLDTEYEWWFDSGNSRVYAYAATDPDSRYTTVESPTRSYGIDLNGKDYLTISYFDISFHGGSEAGGIRNQSAYAEYDLIEYNEVHHNGVLSSDPQGNGLFLRNINNTTIRHNLCYHNARRGIVTWAEGTGHTANNNIVEYNEVYNSYHAGIDNFISASASQMDNLIVRYNYVHTVSATYGQGWLASWGHVPMHGILVQSDHTTNRVTNSKIYYNLILNQYENAGIVLRGNNGTAIYNNTISGVMGGGLYTYGISVNNDGQPNSNIVIKNNIAKDRIYGGLFVPDKTMVSACDYNDWFDTTGTNPFAVINGVSYHSDDFSAYKSATGWDTNGKWQDPLFNSSSDLHLQVSSPCKDAGADVSLVSDYTGIIIPQGSRVDIGAYETFFKLNLGFLSGLPNGYSDRTYISTIPIDNLFMAVYQITFDSKLYLLTTDRAGNYTSIVLPGVTSVILGDTSLAVTKEGGSYHLWVYFTSGRGGWDSDTGWTPDTIQPTVHEFILSGSPLPTSAIHNSSHTVGDLYSVSGTILKLASGALLLSWYELPTPDSSYGYYQDSNLNTAEIGFQYRTAAGTWQSEIRNGAITNTTIAKVTGQMIMTMAQHPADGSIWCFTNGDSFYRIWKIHLTEASNNVTVDSSGIYLDQNTPNGQGPEYEFPQIIAVPDPYRNVIQLAYQNQNIRYFTLTTPVIKGSYVSICSINADASKSILTYDQYVANSDGLNLSVVSNGLWILNFPINVDLNVNGYFDNNAIKYTFATSTWGNPIYFNTIRSTVQSNYASINTPQFITQGVNGLDYVDLDISFVSNSIGKIWLLQ